MGAIEGIANQQSVDFLLVVFVGLVAGNGEDSLKVISRHNRF